MLLDMIIVSVFVVFSEIIPNPTDELERFKINVASERRDPANYQFLIGMQHIDDEDGLVFIKLATVCKGYVVAYRRLVTTAWNRLRLT